MRQLAQRLGGYGGLAMLGTPAMIADQMQHWLESEACDGFNVMFPFLPAGLEEFVDQVVPELQRRRLFRRNYEGRTLREHLGLTGSKKGCDHGQCGACTVLINGRRINACLTLAVMHQDDEITTIEGLGTPERLHPLQTAFIKHDDFQCGYCTPGQICSAVGMLDEVAKG